MSVPLGEFGLARAVEIAGEEGVDRLLAQALYYYLAERETGRAGWAYPRFRPGTQPTSGGTDVALVVGDEAWEAFAVEARNQGVAPEQLLHHALLYFVADLDAGRVTERILAEFADEEESGGQQQSG